MPAYARSLLPGPVEKSPASRVRPASAAATLDPPGVNSARRVQPLRGSGPAPRDSSGSGLAARALAACLAVATFHDAAAEPTRDAPGPPPEVAKPGGGGTGKVQPWQWQLGVGIPLLTLGVILTAVGGAFVADPPVTDPSGCNVLGFAGPCLLGRSSSGTLLGFGLAFGVGGVVLTGLGIHSRVQSGSPLPVVEPTIKDLSPAPGSTPAASAE